MPMKSSAIQRLIFRPFLGIDGTDEGLEAVLEEKDGRYGI